MKSPYRAPRPQKQIDREPEAAAELRRRAKRVRLGAAALCVGGPIVFGLPAYLLLRDLQSALFGGVYWPMVCLMLGVIVPLGFGIWATATLAQWILRRRIEPWVSEVSATYGVPRADLLKYTTPWR